MTLSVFSLSLHVPVYYKLSTFLWWPYATLIACELQVLQYTHYQDVFGRLDVDKWTYDVAPEIK